MQKKAEIKPEGRVNVLSTFNNTIVSVSDKDGNVLIQESCGGTGFKGARRATPYAATVTTERAVLRAKQLGIKEVDVFIKGPGAGRDAALRAIRAANLKINMIADVTPIPHNGVRPRKKRRV